MHSRAAACRALQDEAHCAATRPLSISVSKFAIFDLEIRFCISFLNEPPLSGAQVKGLGIHVLLDATRRSHFKSFLKMRFLKMTGRPRAGQRPGHPRPPRRQRLHGRGGAAAGAAPAPSSRTALFGLRAGGGRRGTGGRVAWEGRGGRSSPAATVNVQTQEAIEVLAVCLYQKYSDLERLAGQEQSSAAEAAAGLGPWPSPAARRRAPEGMGKWGRG